MGLLLALSFFGIADSWYLTEVAATGGELACDFGGEPGGCQEVAESPYSRFIGIPMSMYGVLFYALIFVVSTATLIFRFKDAPFILVLLSGTGAGLSVIFLGIQIFLIQAVCAYCIASAVISFALFIIAWLLYVGRKEKFNTSPTHV